MAYLEAASVVAFVALAQELEEHGAPARLRTDSLRAVRDETRHAAVMKGLAEGAGANVAPVRVVRRRRRSIEAMALENAVEGCVGETYSAAIAQIQAKRATHLPFRAVMKRIAADETRHAELSWRLASWFDRKLTTAARSRVRNARAHAAEELARSAATATDGRAASELGLPTAPEAAALIAELRKCLWT